jgi:hypothetical protein
METASMKFKFTEKKMAEIEKVLNTKFSRRGNQYRTILENEQQNRKLTLEIYIDIPIGAKKGNLVSVYTPSAHAQIHFCSGFVASDMLGEVTFIGEHGGHISGIIIEKDAAFSNYSNVDANLLSEDFTQLGPEVMLSGIALSLAEHLLEESSK